MTARTPSSGGKPSDQHGSSDPAWDRNPVRRARRMVEAEVPPSRRGPGWDRHWRELEAYAESKSEWTVPSSASDD